MSKMPCNISDGPQTPEDVPEYIETDGDAVYDEQRQLKIDDLAFVSVSQDLIDQLAENNKIMDRLMDGLNKHFTKEQAE